MNGMRAWREVPLGEILSYLDERVQLDDSAEYVTITVKRRHGGLVERERLFGHQIKTKKQFRLVPGAFIISRVQCWHQAYAMVPEEIPENMIASTNYDQYAISPKVDRRFFWWLSFSPRFTETVRSSASGVVIEKMVFKRENWLKKTVPLPPLSEQRRIVARIDELAAKIKEARGLRHDALRKSEALISSAYEKMVQNHADRIQRLALGILSTRNGLSRRPSGIETGPIVLRLADVADGRVDLSSPRRGVLSMSEIEKYQLRKGDLLFVRVNGSLSIVGRCIIFPGASEPVCFNDHLIRVRLDRAVLDPEYASRMASSRLAREYFERTAITTAGQNTINQKMLASMPIPIPTLTEQRHIVSYLNDVQGKVDALKHFQERTAAELDALLPSILDKAFKGEL